MTTGTVDATTPPLPARRRWYEPRSWIGTVALFVVGYVLFQAFWRAAFEWMDLFGDEVPFTADTWRGFLLVVACLGAVAGSLWWWASRLRRGRLRRTIRSTVRMLAFFTAHSKGTR